ncbi:class I SAM-dependent methyltransferase [Xanthomonas sp. LMG 12460]|uniref:class I SAM-dependent methyltransferase n=1 Tax=Xanthomonas sp. LMG 12460 TaxID=1591132 RepID=UPI0012658932|nr:class I SAM-dependent methyltransferase [Xanthomonas sp. LMG 12460]KAB7774966.1 SAM-dependent methyltransferase [Xanthomonas sp. LMG 12460]
MTLQADSAELQRQYGDTQRLAQRKSLHAKYGRGDWYPWLRAQVPLAADMRVADIGCGTGQLWGALAGQWPPSLALQLLDRSPAMVAAALAQAAALRPRGVVGDAMRLPLRDASIDAALAVHMLYHLPDPHAGVRELRRIVRPGAAVLAVLNGRDNMRQLAQLVAGVAGGPDRDPSTLRLDAEAGARLFAMHFAQVRVARFDDVLVCTDPEDVVAYLQSLPLPPQAHASALRQAVEAAFAHGDGALRIDKDVRAIFATA